MRLAFTAMVNSIGSSAADRHMHREGLMQQC
jgi:hypothetical protein